MKEHGYTKGRLNLPFVGISTFGKSPYIENWDDIKADVAILGAPFDSGTQWRPGARFGPKSIREASMLFSFGHAGAYDHEDDVTYLDSSVRMVDIGDADIIHTKTSESHNNIELGVKKILEAAPYQSPWVETTQLIFRALMHLKIFVLIMGLFILFKLMLILILLMKDMV